MTSETLRSHPTHNHLLTILSHSHLQKCFEESLFPFPPEFVSSIAAVSELAAMAAAHQAILAAAPATSLSSLSRASAGHNNPTSARTSLPLLGSSFTASVAGLRLDSNAALALTKALGVDVAIRKEGRSNVRRAVVSASASAVEPQKILMMGGTRFIGLFLARELVKAGHEVTLFTRGKAPVTQQLPGESDQEFADYSSKVKHIQGDRQDYEGLKEKLQGTGFQVVYDINGREGKEVEPILEALPGLQQYIFCSSAGVYLKSDQLPHFEVDAVDPKSRHKGKLDTETLLQSKGTPWTSIRPVYIYGPLNYNPVEEWFFQRLKEGRPIPVPGSGMQITQLGHVKDLATAFVKVLKNEKAYGQVYNISGSKYVTFDGIAKACAKAGRFPEPQLVHYNPKEFDFGKKKAFPLRDQHFFTSIEKSVSELGWAPEFGLVEGLTDSYNLDFGRGTFRKAADFSTDDMILEKLGVKSAVPA